MELFWDIAGLAIVAALSALLVYVYYYHTPKRLHAARLELNKEWTERLNQHVASNMQLSRDNERLRKENAQALKERLHAYNQGFLAGNIEASKRHNNHAENVVALNA